MLSTPFENTPLAPSSDPLYVDLRYDLDVIESDNATSANNDESNAHIHITNKTSPDADIRSSIPAPPLPHRWLQTPTSPPTRYFTSPCNCSLPSTSLMHAHLHTFSNLPETNSLEHIATHLGLESEDAEVVIAVVKEMARLEGVGEGDRRWKEYIEKWVEKGFEVGV